jgi:hypothetical protein
MVSAETFPADKGFKSLRTNLSSRFIGKRVHSTVAEKKREGLLGAQIPLY